MSTTLKLSVAEYDDMVAKGAFDGLAKKIELIHGEVQAMNPACPVHDDLIEYLTDWSKENTDRRQIRVRVQLGLSLPEFDSRPEPDVLWVKARRYLAGHPQASDVLLLIEVSDSSLKLDRDQKAELYAKAAIVEYWIVNMADEVVHIYRDPDHSGYRTLNTVARGGAATPLIQPAAALNISDLFGHE
ncbi:MAG TPA: Uma2 family endonuclease [Pirellulaceae bacterium]|nr:Uma2 family endonuclease [Pirellulaceae bacterium]